MTLFQLYFSPFMDLIWNFNLLCTLTHLCLVFFNDMRTDMSPVRRLLLSLNTGISAQNNGPSLESSSTTACREFASNVLIRSLFAANSLACSNVISSTVAFSLL